MFAYILLVEFVQTAAKTLYDFIMGAPVLPVPE